MLFLISAAIGDTTGTRVSAGRFRKPTSSCTFLNARNFDRGDGPRHDTRKQRAESNSRCAKLRPHIGRAEVADEVVGPNFTELWISIDPEADYDETVRRVHEAMTGYPGMYCDVQTYLKERTKEVLSGAGASIVVRIYGPEIDVLRKRPKK